MPISRPTTSSEAGRQAPPSWSRKQLLQSSDDCRILECRLQGAKVRRGDAVARFRPFPAAHLEASEETVDIDAEFFEQFADAFNAEQALPHLAPAFVVVARLPGTSRRWVVAAAPNGPGHDLFPRERSAAQSMAVMPSRGTGTRR